MRVTLSMSMMLVALVTVKRSLDTFFMLEKWLSLISPSVFCVRLHLQAKNICKV